MRWRSARRAAHGCGGCEEEKSSSEGLGRSASRQLKFNRLAEFAVGDDVVGVACFGGAERGQPIAVAPNDVVFEGSEPAIAEGAIPGDAADDGEREEVAVWGDVVEDGGDIGRVVEVDVAVALDSLDKDLKAFLCDQRGDGVYERGLGEFAGEASSPALNDGREARLLLRGQALKEVACALGVSRASPFESVEALKARHKLVDAIVAHLKAEGVETSEAEDGDVFELFGWRAGVVLVGASVVGDADVA